jgi:ElaB/YqjD/DUF883 family membrane-anchored ribosome-binding protein
MSATEKDRTSASRFNRDVPEIKDAPALGDIQHDIQLLKNDMSRLTSQLAEIVTAKGAFALDKARTSLDDAVGSATAKGKEMAEATRDATDSTIDAIEESVRERPFTTLALTLGLGFMIGAAWRR